MNASPKPISISGVAVTILAGLLNWLGVNPKISCRLPPPSK